MNTHIRNFFGCVLLFVIVFGAAFLNYSLLSSKQAEASVVGGNEYNATTTDASWAGNNVIKLLKTGQGTFGSVVVTNLNTGGTIRVYDATTTDNTKRTKLATTTLASFSATAPGGTYTFDAIFVDGLTVEVSAAPGVASSTITFR